MLDRFSNLFMIIFAVEEISEPPLEQINNYVSKFACKSCGTELDYVCTLLKIKFVQFLNQVLMISLVIVRLK